nr:DegT/DnrJ/EryC1/StrS family aminotransferase [Clostridium chromiireducens]
MKIPAYDMTGIHNEIKKQVSETMERVIDKNWFIQGEEVNSFEKEYAEFTGTNEAIGVSNGLDALNLSLVSLEIPKGSEVIIPGNTFIATALAASYADLKVVLVDPDIDTYTIDSKKIENAITDKTKAIMPVHLYGRACEMDAIMEIAKKYGLYVIEDNAQAQGATYKGRQTGTFGDAAATSFYPGKNIGAFGDGGGITTNNDELAKKIRMYQNYGSEQKYYHEYKGFNARLDEIQAAILRIKLPLLKKWNNERKEIAQIYGANINNSKIILPQYYEGNVWHQYVIRTEQRDELQKYLSDNGISTVIHYPIPIHKQKAYSELSHYSLPVTEELCNTVLSLPIYPYIGEEKLNYIIDVLNRY